MIKPITPAEALDAKLKAIPEFIIESVNKVLTAKITEGSRQVRFDQDDVMAEVMTHATERGFTRNQVYERNWLDFEPIFREFGWEVEFIKTPYYDSSPNYWVFTAKRAR